MFEREWEDGCPSCTYATDDLCTLAHLHDMDTSYALVSLAASDKLERWKANRGSDVPWYSSGSSTFNQDFGASVDDAEIPGYSTFYREGGDVFHAYSTFQRGTELLVSSTQQLDLTHLGRRM